MDYYYVPNYSYLPDDSVIKYINSKFDEIKMENNKFMNNLENKKRSKKRQDKRCYTCKPRGKVKKHIIGASNDGQFIFHHDMGHRPLILITPVEHAINIEDLSIEKTKALFDAIKSFCIFWSINDYQISFNCGQWKTHEHFHVKIKINEKIANRMRGDHFRRIKLEQNYSI